MAVAEHAVHAPSRCSIQHVLEDLERQSRDADEPHLAPLLQLQQRRKRLVDNLVETDKLHIVTLDQVDKVQAQSLETLVDAPEPTERVARSVERESG